MEDSKTSASTVDERYAEQDAGGEGRGLSPEATGQSFRQAGGELGEQTAPDQGHWPCDDVTFEQLQKLEMQGTEAAARLGEVERRLSLSENKMRSCDDMLELIGLLKNRMELVYEAGMLPRDDDGQTGHVAAAAPQSPMRGPVRSSLRSPTRSPLRSLMRSPRRSPMRSPMRSSMRSPTRSPDSPIKSPRSN